MTKRIIGIDVARALAIIGMIIVNFKMVFGQEGQGWLHSKTIKINRSFSKDFLKAFA